MYQNVCLVNPSWVQREHSIWENVEGRTIPFGLGYLASVIERDSDARVSIIDAKAEDLTLQETLHRVMVMSPDMVGIGTSTYDYNDGVTLARMIKERVPDISICLGGSHVSALPEAALENTFIDFVVRGEGEYTFLELVKGYSCKKIKGLSYKDGGTVVHNADRPVTPLDDLPRLSYHLLPMEKYFPTAGQCRRLPAGAMVVSRGCPGRCIFCCSSVTGKRMRRFSPQRIQDEITFLVETYKIREIVFMDDTMTYPREEMVTLCNLMKSSQYDLIWDCSTRVDCVDKPLLTLMKEAGCNQISFGIESGNDRVLNSIHKRHQIKQVKNAVTLAKACGLEVRGSFILGFPEDTVETMNQTMQFSQELKLDLASFYIATPYPGTEMFEWAKRNGQLTADWSQYDQSHCCMKIPHADCETVEHLYRKAWRSFYLRPQYLFNRLKMVKSVHDLSSAFRAVKGVFSAEVRRV
jgi:radical SAM superfamily enzyme YgiQ (UPF0313 family)